MGGDRRWHDYPCVFGPGLACRVEGLHLPVLLAPTVRDAGGEPTGHALMIGRSCRAWFAGDLAGARELADGVLDRIGDGEGGTGDGPVVLPSRLPVGAVAGRPGVDVGALGAAVPAGGVAAGVPAVRAGEAEAEDEGPWRLTG